MLSKIGKYEIVSEIGHGGFGRVYKARDPNFAHTVAIKLFSAEADPGLLARFRSEAATTANLRHANIVTVHDFGDENGIPYIVMEYLEGNTLRAVANGTVKLTIAEKVRVLMKAAAGLQYAHERGIVHRDVKLENIMLLNDGSVKLMDFGIARFLNDEGTRVTIEGSLVGTLKYMAPEQFHQTEADQLTDIFSFGVVEYEVLAGRHPFPGTNEGAVLHQLLTVDPVRINELIPGCPERLADAVARALSKQRDQRFQSMEDLRFENQAAIADLEKQEARSLTLEAEGLLSDGDLEGAKIKVRRAMEMDATSEISYKLRKRIDEEARSREVRPRVASLVERGDGLLAERQIPEAIRAFEQALSLDRQNTQVKERLHKAQEAQARAKRIAQLVEAATRDLEHNNLTAAFQHASQGLDDDPANRQLLELLARVRKIQDQRARAAAIQAAINQARGLLLAREFEHALGILTGAESQHGSSPLLEELKDQIQLELARDRRSKELEACLKQAREWIRGAQFADAERMLGEMKDRFPESVELKQLLQFAQEQVEAERQRLQIERTAVKIRTAIEQHDLIAAEELLESISSYTDETRVQELAAIVAKARRYAEREHAIRVACQRAEDFLQHHKFDEARGAVDACLAGGEDPRLLALIHKIDEAFATFQRNAEIAAAAEQAVELTRMMSFGEATQIIGRAIQQYGSDKRLSAAQKEILALESEWKAAEATRLALEEGRAALQKGDFAGAYAAASKFSEEYRRGDEGRQFLADIKQQEELAAANRKVDAAAALLEQDKASEAQELLTSVLLVYPQLPSAMDLHAKLKQVEESARAKAQEAEIARKREEDAELARKREEDAELARKREEDAELARKREVEDARKREEQARKLAEQQVREAELSHKRQAAEQAAEDERKAKLAREAEEARVRKAEEDRKAEEERQRKAAAEKAAEEERKAKQVREAEEARKRKAEEDRKTEEERQRKAAAAKAAEEERKPKADGDKKREKARRGQPPPVVAPPETGDGATQIFSSPAPAATPPLPQTSVREEARVVPPVLPKSAPPPVLKANQPDTPRLAPLPAALSATPTSAATSSGNRMFLVSGAAVLVVGIAIWFFLGSKPTPSTSVASVHPTQTAPPPPTNPEPTGNPASNEPPKPVEGTNPTVNNPSKTDSGKASPKAGPEPSSAPKDPSAGKSKYPPLPPLGTGDQGKANPKSDGGGAGRGAAKDLNLPVPPPSPPIDSGNPVGVPAGVKAGGNPPPPPSGRTLIPFDNYNGSHTGSVRWNGDLAPGATLTIHTSSVSTGKSSAAQNFPNSKLKVTVNVPAKITVLESPGPGNDWDVLTLRNDTQEVMPLIQYTWTIIR